MKNRIIQLLIILFSVSANAQIIMTFNDKKYDISKIDSIVFRSVEIPSATNCMEKTNEYSIFVEALRRTGLADSLVTNVKEKEYLMDNPTDRDGYYSLYYPKRCDIGWTIFAESDDVFNTYGIKNFTDLVIKCKEWYGNPSWYDLLTERGVIVSTGTDYTYEYIESWANLFNYDLVFRVVLTFNKNADIEEYLDDYKELLINSGYKLDESANAYRYKTEEFENSILFNIDSTNNMVYMQFKAETFLSDEAIMNALKDSGFPTFDISSIDSTSKEVTDMYSVLYNQEHDYVYIVSLNFESVEEVNTFLDEYIINTLCNSGFESVSPEYARVPHKDFAYYNETKKLIVCFNYTNQGFISLHFIDAASDFQPNSGE